MGINKRRSYMSNIRRLEWTQRGDRNECGCLSVEMRKRPTEGCRTC